MAQSYAGAIPKSTAPTSTVSWGDSPLPKQHQQKFTGTNLNTDLIKAGLSAKQAQNIMFCTGDDTQFNIEVVSEIERWLHSPENHINVPYKVARAISAVQGTSIIGYNCVNKKHTNDDDMQPKSRFLLKPLLSVPSKFGPSVPAKPFIPKGLKAQLESAGMPIPTVTPSLIGSTKAPPVKPLDKRTKHKSMFSGRSQSMQDISSVGRNNKKHQQQESHVPLKEVKLKAKQMDAATNSVYKPLWPQAPPTTTSTEIHTPNSKNAKPFPINEWEFRRVAENHMFNYWGAVQNGAVQFDLKDSKDSKQDRLTMTVSYTIDFDLTDPVNQRPGGAYQFAEKAFPGAELPQKEKHTMEKLDDVQKSIATMLQERGIPFTIQYVNGMYQPIADATTQLHKMTVSLEKGEQLSVKELNGPKMVDINI